MERGGCDSNCMISFNLPLVKTKGEVTIAKYDSSKDPAVPLKDVEFGLYSDPECTELIETLKSDASGMLKVENLNVPDGQTRYYLKETKALPGYKTDKQVYTLVPGEAVNGVSTFIVQDENGDTIGTIEIGSKSYPVIYNKKPEPISLSVEKSWLDEDGNEILDPSSYSATFHVHRLKSYTEHIVVDLPAPPTSTLKIGYYYYDGPWWAPVRQYGLYNGLSYDYVAETDATVTYDYNNSHTSHRYIIDGEENDYLPDSDTVTIHMPEAGETTTIYFYDEWRNGWALSTTVKGQESKPVHVERDEPHEYEPDPSFECEPITLENGATSGTFDSGEEEYEGTENEGKFPVKKTIDDVLYTYTYYITEDPVEGFISSSGDHYSEEDDLTESFVNQKKPKSQPIDVDEKPDYDKTLKENTAANGKWDGTYTLSLDVTGKAISKQSSAKDKADIILVLDMSSSMREPVSEGRTRYDTEMAAVRALSERLMGLNSSTEPDNIRMSVITFGNHAEIKGVNTTTQQGISDVLDTIEMPPNGQGADAYNIGQGTNWEAALSAVQSIRTRDKDIADTMVIFVSDGNPTLRDTLGDYAVSDVPTGYEKALKSITGAYGLGTDVKSENAVGYLALLSQEHYDKSVKRCYDAAVPLAQQIVDSGKELYTIAVFGSLDRMKNLVTDVGEASADYYKHAEDPQALAVAFEELFDRASKAIDFRNVKICDPLTAAAKTLMSVNGTPVDFKYYKVDKNNQETPWTDAPTAVFDEDTATVDWDLSSVGALENDVTYRVSFTVWPNQDAYDAVLELNQSDKKPETVKAILSKEKYRDIAQYITKDSEGNFIVYSNGDATLKYRKAVSIDGGDPVLGPEETLYYPHPSMKTQQYTMKVAKLWNDSIYPNNRLNKVKFEIYEDNAPYSVCQEIILDSKDFPSDATRWEAEVPVSPAIRSDTIIDGVKLNQGHSYTVKEYIWVEGADEEEGQWVKGETDFHYEFDPENVTPILLNGNLGYEGDTNGDAALSGTNHVRGYVDVRKQVFDVDGTTDISDTDDTEFSFKVSLKDKNGNPIKYSQYPATANTAEDDKIVKGNLTVDGHAYPIWYALFEGDDRTGLDEEDIEFGIIEDGETMQINAKQTFQLFNVPSGTWYSFAEQAISGYVIKNGTSATQSGTQVHNGSAEILFQNVKHVNKTTSVTLKKVDKDDLNATNPDLLSGAIFTITRYPSQDAPGKDTEWGDDGSKTLADEKVGDNYTLGGIFTFDDLTEGYYVIEEDKYPEGYVKLSGNPSFKVSANASGDLIITIVNDADGLVKLIDGQMVIKVGNERGAALPATGGPGTNLIYILGIMLTGLAGAGLMMRKRGKML